MEFAQYRIQAGQRLLHGQLHHLVEALSLLQFAKVFPAVGLILRQLSFLLTLSEQIAGSFSYIWSRSLKASASPHASSNSDFNWS